MSDIYNTALVWYTKEEWEKMKKICEDPEVFEDSYEEW